MRRCSLRNTFLTMPYPAVHTNHCSPIDYAVRHMTASQPYRFVMLTVSTMVVDEMAIKKNLRTAITVSGVSGSFVQSVLAHKLAA